MLNTLTLRLEKLSFAETGNFSKWFLDYLSENPSLTEFYNVFPKIENFQKIIDDRHFPQENRERIVEVVNEQYDDLVLSGKMLKNLAQLKKSTCFTVTTGHQLNIFTGPLYFIYKIVSAINACKVLEERYPDHQFVPVYWMASEDHDFAEINHFHLFGKEYVWDTNQEGAVGRFDTEGIAKLIEEIPDCPQLFKDAYAKGNTLANATRHIVNELFGDYGLVVVDADHASLKRLFLPIIKDELVHHNAYAKVLSSSEKMNDNGYKTLVTPREINLFYLTDETRQRIVKKDGRYEVLATNISFSEKEINSLMDNHPECFSPNVVLRTLYQETILPNIAYIGGPGELSYWFQFKSTFDHYKLPFPVLLPRNSALIINKGQMKKYHKLNLQISDIFKQALDLKQSYIKQNADQSLDLQKEKDLLQEVYQVIIEKATLVDGSLQGFVKAEEAKAVKNLDQIEKRLKKSEEQKQAVSLNQLMALKDKLFPQGGLQERHDNFLNFYMNNPQFIQDLVEHFDAFNFNFHVIMEDG